MKTLLLLFPCALLAQLPVLPPVNTLTIVGVTCTYTVIDPQMSVATECVDSTGTILYRSVTIPHIKGNLIGAGPIQCLLSTDGAAVPTVRLQCMTDDDTAIGPKIALDGKLAPVIKKHQWWLFWK